MADLVPERLDRVEARGAEVIDIDRLDGDGLGEEIRSRTDGRGADSVIDAVGMESHGSGRVKVAQKVVGLLPDVVAEPLSLKAGTDRLTALLSAFDSVRRGGTVSIFGVYGGAVDPLPLMDIFDKQVQIRMGQANVRRWSDDILEPAEPRRGRARRRVVRHPPPVAGGGAGRLRDVPEEAGRRRQDRLPALVFRPWSLVVRDRSQAVVPDDMPRDFGVRSTGSTMSAASSGSDHLSEW